LTGHGVPLTFATKGSTARCARAAISNRSISANFGPLSTVEKLVLNTAGGWTAHPQVMERLKSLSNQAASDPSWERIKTRLEFLMYDKSMVYDDLIETRRSI
jgi:hypothetical protein